MHYMIVERFRDDALIHCADNLFFDLAVFEDEKGGNTSNIETCTGCHMCIDIELPDFDASFVFFSNCVDSFNAVSGPLFSTTRIGITRKLTSVQAIPTRPATNRPTFSDRSSMIRKTRPTVAEMGRPSRARAVDASAPASVGSAS